jgi:hypothetical protein
MKSLSNTILILFLLSAIIQPLGAQSADRVWEEGTVWGITYVETKPGHFNDYLMDLSKVWKTFLEAQIRDGHVISYKMLNVSSPRDGESNLILMVEYKNWATFDKMDSEYTEKLINKIMGSVEMGAQSNIDRGELRTIRGGITAQEIKFMK